VIDWSNPATWRVLVVDDELDNLEIVAETLEYQGITVKTAMNGKEALTILETFDANLILTDLSMPVMNGWDMRARIRSDKKFEHVPILALSAHAIAGDKERALEVGFDGYLTKPINIFSLVDDVRSAAIKTPVDNKESL
jgi:CheY-like chemotaxis protein